MKKIILTLGLVFAFGLTNAQETKFGIKGGLNNTNWTGDFDTDAKTSFYLGGLVDITVSEKFHVQPELLYSSEGASDDLGVSYLRLPIMAKFYVADGFSLQAGPELAFKIGAEEDAVDDSIKSLDYGLGVGAGYELTSGLFFDLRYNLGLANISEDDNFDIKNTGLQFGLGYRF
jgi:opacity protein-like surface antigen